MKIQTTLMPGGSSKGIASVQSIQGCRPTNLFPLV